MKPQIVVTLVLGYIACAHGALRGNPGLPFLASLGDHCASTEYCCPDAKHCLTPTKVSCAKDASVCSADQTCCPLTKLCVHVGKPCASPCKEHPPMERA